MLDVVLITAKRKQVRSQVRVIDEGDPPPPSLSEIHIWSACVCVMEMKGKKRHAGQQVKLNEFVSVTSLSFFFSSSSFERETRETSCRKWFLVKAKKNKLRLNSL